MAHGMKGTAGDMIRSLLIILIPLVAITWFFTRTPEVKPEPVDIGPTLAQARESAPYPVLAPVALPPEWVTTRVTWTPTGDPLGAAAWRVGVISPNEIYFEVRQVAGSSAALVAKGTRDGAPEGHSTVAGTSWQRYVSDDGRTNALVQRTDDATTVVAADAPFEALEAFAATLSTD